MQVKSAVKLIQSIWKEQVVVWGTVAAFVNCDSLQPLPNASGVVGFKLGL